MLTDAEIALLTHAEIDLLTHATKDTRKFAMEIGYYSSEAEQLALENLMRNDHVRLIDVSIIAAMPGRLVRVFIITAAGERALAQARA
jgi:hypothetical protein